MPLRVKICCISSIREAEIAVAHGASAVGLVGRMPGGPGPIPDERIYEIARTVPPGVSTFLLTSETDPESVIRHHRATRTDIIQLVDRLQPDSYQVLREALPAIRLVQVVHVLNEQSVTEALAAAEHADAILLDSGNPDLAVKQLGGTGRTHNWDLSREIRERVPVPVYLAGGLHPGNVKDAVQRVRPFGIDLCSGLRTNGNLDENKVENLFKQMD
ncbi:MAG: phosphoribosylanthranilate isomerase [candidate division KSB1 bacterium]|nr:phosphoribosylanthranilate isomerase [candidate division KSB1 bacterium]